jgi:hypothetical protein
MAVQNPKVNSKIKFQIKTNTKQTKTTTKPAQKTDKYCWIPLTCEGG